MMNVKRQSESIEVIEPTSAKRYRTSDTEINSDALSKASQPRVDPTYGQRGAFPGLDDSNADDALFYGPASDGLEYLRMVRSEARGVPNLLVANSAAVRQPEGGHFESAQGYYADGAYTAAPIPTANYDSREIEDNDSGDTQEAYYSTFCSRFRSLTSILQNPPPSNFIHDSAFCTAQKLSTGGRQVWRSALNTNPSMVVLGQLPQDAVLQGIQMLELRLANGGLWRKNSLSLWSWGLLARCRDAGQMGSEEIGILRDLGKRAIWVLRGLRAGMNHDTQDEELESEGDDNESIVNGLEKDREDYSKHAEKDQECPNPEAKALTSSVEVKSDEAEATSTSNPDESPHHASYLDDTLAAAKARVLSSLPQETLAQEPSTPTEETSPVLNDGQSLSHDADTAGSAQIQEQQGEMLRLHATLDMIITVVGEFYGQRDLLEGRLVWGEVDIEGE